MSTFFHTSNVTNTTGELIDWTELCHKVENPPTTTGDYEQAKISSAVVGAHDLSSSKKKEPVLKHDSFTMLRLDLDDNAPTLKEVEQSLIALGFSRFLIYTTAKHQQTDTETGEDFGNRLRVFIPLRKPLKFSSWQCTQIGLSCHFDTDPCADRPQQIMFLPTRYEGDKYDFTIVNDSENGKDLVKGLAMKGVEIQKANIVEGNKERFESVKQYTEKKVGNSVSIIDTFNKVFALSDVLREEGYTMDKSGRWRSPWSSKGANGGIIVKCNVTNKDKYITWSGSEQERLGMEKQSKSNCTVHSYDAFDMWCLFNTDGDSYKAVLKAATEIFKDIDKHNKREYAVTKHNEKVKGVSA